VVTFDVLEVFDEEEGIDLQVLPEFSMTQPLNANCDTVGYGSTNTMDNLGSLNYIIVFLLLKIVIFAAQRVTCCHRQTRLNVFMIDKEQLVDDTQRFMLETFFDLFLIVLLTFAPVRDGLGVFYLEEWNGGDKLSVVFQWFLVAVMVVFVLVVIYATLCLVKPGRHEKYSLHNKIILDILRAKQDLSCQELSRPEGNADLAQGHQLEKTSNWVQDDSVVLAILLSVERLPEDDHQLYFNFVEMLFKDEKHLGRCVDQLNATVFARLIHNEAMTSEDLGLLKELFVGLDLTRRSAAVYNLVFLVRRTLFIVTAVLGHQRPDLQIIALLLLTLMNLIYLVLARPFEDSAVQKSEVMNEHLVYSSVVFSLLLLVYQHDSEVQDKIGWVMFAQIVGNIAFNMIFALK